VRGPQGQAAPGAQLETAETPKKQQAPPGEDPVEILVGLAEQGEIDPWNIDIIEVTDRFLSELEKRRKLNLQVSGRTLFYAATLLRMKSEQMQIQAEGEGDGDYEEGGDEDFGLFSDDFTDYSGRLGPIERLEHEIQRRLDRKSMRKSPITLFELISELKNIEKEERRRRRLAAPDSTDDLIDADDVVSIAHEEDYQDDALMVLQECLVDLDEGGEMTLNDICARLGWTCADAYIPLLFLAIDGTCSLRQEEFFGDLYVQICRTEMSAAAPEEAGE
jgi:segregation and condensation protein A